MAKFVEFRSNDDLVFVNPEKVILVRGHAGVTRIVFGSLPGDEIIVTEKENDVVRQLEG